MLSRSLQISGETAVRARGSLALSGPRELLAKCKVPAAFNPDGSPASDTRVWPGRPPDSLVPDRLEDESVVEICEEEVLWGGCVQPHYGHFLTESVSRLWPLLPGGPLEGRPVVCVRPPLLRYEREWTEAFAAATIAVPEGGVVRFTRMFVPEPAWLLNAWISPEIRDIHLRARRNMDVPALPRQGIVWLSRSALERDQRAYDEELLEWLLAEHVTIVRLETKTLPEQIALIEASDGLAGLVGSAFHTLLCAVEVPDCALLCKGDVLSAFVAQDRLLSTNGAFIQALAKVEMHRRRRSRSLGGYRVLVPEALRGLSATMLPELRENARLAALMRPEGPASAVGRRRQEPDEVVEAVSAVLLDPYCVHARMRLAAMFEERELSGCALEQFLIVAELSDNDHSPARSGAARMLARIEDGGEKPAAGGA